MWILGLPQLGSAFSRGDACHSETGVSQSVQNNTLQGTAARCQAAAAAGSAASTTLVSPRSCSTPASRARRSFPLNPMT
uniref:Uncharacterized protein n=1 Tax=Triticum urartu TaxID=4572 RepID=A0A8R7PFH5_TRIUA